MTTKPVYIRLDDGTVKAIERKPALDTSGMTGAEAIAALSARYGLADEVLSASVSDPMPYLNRGNA